jgi:hypothetical protein
MTRIWHGATPTTKRDESYFVVSTETTSKPPFASRA